MDKHNKHSKNKNKGVNKPQIVPVSGSGLLPGASGTPGEAAPAAKVQPKASADKRK